MFGKMFELAGFFSKDFAHFWAQQNFHNSLHIEDFSVRQNFSSPEGIGIAIGFVLENKLRSLNNVSQVNFSMDGVCIPFTWDGAWPGALSPRERRTFSGHTGAIPGKDAGRHKCQLEIFDSLKRAHAATCVFIPHPRPLPSGEGKTF